MAGRDDLAPSSLQEAGFAVLFRQPRTNQREAATMGKIVNSTFVSLDGVTNHMERWHFDFIDDEMHAFTLKQLRDSEAMLMGRRTYESYAAAWPGRDGEYPDGINRIKKYVASTTLKTAEWANTTIINGDLIATVTKLKRESRKDILMHGYGPVAKALMRAGLLDEVCLWVHPVLAGAGGMDDLLLDQGSNVKLGLLETRPLRSGVVVLRYSSQSAAAGSGPVGPRG
jgi:dihydrofolate reductase